MRLSVRLSRVMAAEQVKKERVAFHEPADFGLRRRSLRSRRFRHPINVHNATSQAKSGDCEQSSVTAVQDAVAMFTVHGASRVGD